MEDTAEFVNDTCLFLPGGRKKTGTDNQRACSSLRLLVFCLLLGSFFLLSAVPLTLAAGGCYRVFARAFGILPVAGITVLFSGFLAAVLLAPFYLGLSAYAHASVTGAGDPLAALPLFYFSRGRYRAAVLYVLGQSVRLLLPAAGLAPFILLLLSGNRWFFPALAAWAVFLPICLRDAAQRAFLPAILVSFPQVGYTAARKMSRRIFSVCPRETLRYFLAGVPILLLVFLTAGLAAVPLYPVFLLGRARRTVHFCLRHLPGSK